MFDVVLCQPEIPPNAGNVIRLCANSGARLHLVEPLGFSMDDKHLRRAGLDYHEMVNVRVHRDWEACAALLGPRRFALTTRGGCSVYETRFSPGDAFIFGREADGLPDAFVARFPPEARLRIPMIAGNRSINLSNAVAVVVYEAWRQNGFVGAGPGEREIR
ncbi:MAG TPA: tRNA (cytidine(34)-2'-O)-methyltransferase [Usitatibacter sp.]|nr:tRNA (cytidine(34)-2'-O)-methyltransferase [Usitatibacter sp.]